MNARRQFLIGMAALYAIPGRAQPAARSGMPVRVGILATPAATVYQPQERVFVETLRELGWVEGRNIDYDRVYADGDDARLPALAAALVARSPDLIYALENSPARAALSKTRTIPIVFGAFADPVEAGIIKSLRQPGGNVTGVTNIGWELSGKRLQLLKEAMPKLSRVGVLMGPGQSSSQGLKLIEKAAGASVKVIPAIAREASEFDAAFASFAESRVEAVLTSHIALFVRERKRIMELAARRRLPVVGHRSELADEGALMTYSSLLADQIRRSAQLADKVLKGTKPADIPVEQPTKFALVVNLRTAKTLGITIPQSVLLQAERVIE